MFSLKIAMATKMFWLQFPGCSTQEVCFRAARRLAWTYHKYHETIFSSHLWRPWIFPRVSHTIKYEILFASCSEDFRNVFQKETQVRRKSRFFFSFGAIAYSFGSLILFQRKCICSDVTCVIITYKLYTVHIANSIQFPTQIS